MHIWETQSYGINLKPCRGKSGMELSGGASRVSRKTLKRCLEQQRLFLGPDLSQAWRAWADEQKVESCFQVVSRPRAPGPSPPEFLVVGAVGVRRFFLQQWVESSVLYQSFQCPPRTPSGRERREGSQDSEYREGPEGCCR